jgi:hypothetical protein
LSRSLRWVATACAFFLVLGSMVSVTKHIALHSVLNGMPK